MAAIRSSALLRPSLPTQMASLPGKPKYRSPLGWLNNQPYLLLSLTSLFWAGNIVLARHVAGHVPPLTLSCLRWAGVFLILLPFAYPHLKRDCAVPPDRLCAGARRRRHRLAAGIGEGVSACA
jgi:hypothetical protein